MPELPLVERCRQEAERFLQQQRIVRAAAVADPIMMPDLSPARFRRTLTGRVIQRVERRGKYLWLVFDRAPGLVLHFGMTGSFVYDPPTRPPHWRFELTLANGHRFLLADPRRFGRVLLVNDPRHEPPVAELGFDPWLDRIPAARFRDAVQARRAPIKAILLDQSFAAGVGNWIADDVLYLAHIDPRRGGHTLSAAECERVRKQLISVVRVATKAGSYEAYFPKSWLFHLRWGRHTGIKTRDGHAVRFDTVATRTTAWVPTRQH